MHQALGDSGPCPHDSIVEDKYSQWSLRQDLEAGDSLTHLGTPQSPQAPGLDHEGVC